MKATMTQAVEAIRLLNDLVVAGERHPNIIEADFLLNAWFDATYGERGRETSGGS